MKNKSPYPEAKPVPMNIPDAQVEEISVIRWDPKNVTIPVSKETIRYYQEQKGMRIDTSVTNSGRITFFLNSTLNYGQIKALRVQDIAVYDIILANNWERPIYFATTCSPDAKIGLDQYMWFKGLCWKLEPAKVSNIEYGVDKNVLEANLLHQPEGFSKTPQYGYKFRELANPKVFYDENVRRIISNYRGSFQRLAIYYLNVEKDPAKGISILDRMESLIPHKNIPFGWQYAWEMANLYQALGHTEKVKDLESDIEPECLDLIAKGAANLNSYYNPYRVLLDFYDMTKQYGKSLDILRKLEVIYPKDPGLKQKIQETEQLMKQSAAITPK